MTTQQQDPAHTIGVLQEGQRQISDRLTNIEENQREDRRATNAAFDATNTRIDDNHRENTRRFDEINNRFDQAQQEANRRHDEAQRDANRRHDEAIKRSDRIFYAILGIGGAIAAAVLGGLLTIALT